MAVVELTLADGIWETTTTTGTGTVTLGGAIAGYKPFSTITAGLQTFYCIRDATNFEIGIGTPSGSSLSRDQIISSTNSNGPVNFSAGTKDVFCDLAYNLVALTYRTNVFAADQDLNGNRLVLDPAGGSDIRAPTDNLIDFYASNVQRMRIDGPNGIVKIYKSDNSATEGPEFRLFRQSASPAASDNLAPVRWTGNDTAGNEVTYAKIRADILTPTSGSIDGRLGFTITANNAQQEVFHIRNGVLSMAANMDLFGNGKTASNHNGTGYELNSLGHIVCVTDNATPLILNRKTADGNIIEIRRDNSNVALVSVSGGVATYGTFTGHHWSEWAPGVEPIEEEGTVVCTAAGTLPGHEHLPLIRPSTMPRERTVYGIITDRQAMRDAPMAPKKGYLMANGLGTYRVRVTGAVTMGDLLETSDVPGVARAQTDDIVRSSTIGKATQDHDGSGRVPCVIYCG